MSASRINSEERQGKKMHIEIWLPLLLMFLFFAMRIPVAFSILISTLVYFLFFNNTIADTVIVQQVIAGSESFTFLAIPFFVTAGVVFNYAGISTRIINFCKVLVGHIRGSLALVNVLCSTLMGGLSGSANADAAMESKFIVPEMVKNGYDLDYSTVVTACSSCITPIIPPGIILIMYASVADVSIARMFYAGYLPGIILCITMMILCWRIAVKQGYGSVREKARGKEIWKVTKDAAWALFLPFGLIMGLRIGMFTPTEGGAMCVVYALLVGKFVYKELKWSDLKPIIIESVEGTAGVMFIIAAAKAFGLYLSWERVPITISEAIISFCSNKYQFLLLVNLLLLIIGCFFDGTAALLLIGPLLIPAAKSYGIDLIHFGIILSINLTLGGVTPPFGGMMYVATSITGSTIEGYARKALPFLAVMIGCLLLFTYVPDIVLLIPRLLS